MLKIKSIHIQKFKGIEDLEMNFTYQGNDNILDNIVFYGINGVGKSTILEAIYLFLLAISLQNQEIKKFINQKDLISSLLKNKINNSKNIDSDNLYIANNIGFLLSEYINLNEDWVYKNKNSFSIKVKYVLGNKEQQSFLEYDITTGLSVKLDTKDNLSQKDFIYLSSYRLLNPSNIQTAGDWQALQINKHNSLFGWNKNSLSILNLQFDNNYKTTKQYLINLITDKLVGGITKENQDILNKIHEAFKIFFPNKKLLEKLPKQADYYKLAIQNEDKSIVDIDQLSSGEREVIAFFTYLCSKAINSSIIIIDEPELHLHAKWQAIILSSLRQIFPNTQIFMASHSDEIHKSLSKSEIFKLSK